MNSGICLVHLDVSNGRSCRFYNKSVSHPESRDIGTGDNMPEVSLWLQTLSHIQVVSLGDQN